MWSTAIADLRVLISDGAIDKLLHRKRCLGILGSKIWKTFEPRRTTDFTTAVAPFGVYVGPTQNGTLATVVSDDMVVGEFELDTAPSGSNTVVEATYYHQWFTDTELSEMLKESSQWLNGSTDFTTMPDGLQPAAKNYAGHLAYKKIATRWAQRMSETYLLQDAPSDKTKSPVEQYLKMASQLLKDATTMRDDFYQRQGRPLSPLFGTQSGKIRETTPMR